MINDSSQNQGQGAACSLIPGNLRCQFRPSPLAVGVGPVRLDWSFASGCGGFVAGTLQSAYQVRVAADPAFHESQVRWDSRRVESPSTHAMLPMDFCRREDAALWWSVRVWDGSGRVSRWSDAAKMEIGPRSRADFQGSWIGPDQTLLAMPLPEMGQWIRAAGCAGHEAVASLETSFELIEGFPRCVGSCWLASDPRCVVLLNGEPLDDHGHKPSLVRPAAINLPWDKLRRGTNTLAISGTAQALGSGVSLMARIWQAEGGHVIVKSSGCWTSSDGSVQVERRELPRIDCDNGPRRSVELSRRFFVDDSCQDARVYITGLGTYELYLNDRRVGDELLTPGWTDTDIRLPYAAHDVTDLLKQGENHLLAKLGNGWWSSGMGWEHKGVAAKPGQPLRLLMDLVAKGSDGRVRRLVVSDGQWLWRPGSILCDTLYHGQTTDLREQGEPWRKVALIDDGLAPVLQPDCVEPIRVVDELRARSITPLKQGEYLYDFGQNHSGRPRLRMKLPEGVTLSVRHCEELDADGNPYFENYRTAAVTDTLITDGSAFDWSPGFTYRGYRYAVLGGLPDGFVPDEGAFVSQLVHNDVREVSSFSCSNPLLNQIDRMVRWGLRTNLHSVPTDCPQRDERLGWTGDVQLIAPTSCWMFDLHSFYTKWLQDLVDAQRPDGGITHIAPFTPVLANESAPVWGDIITVLPEVLHRFYDDPELLAKLYEPIKRWVGWYEAQACEGLVEAAGFGDWVALEETPSQMCGTAYFAHSSRLLSTIATTLGRHEDAMRYAKQSQHAARAYHQKYFDASLGYYQPNTQTAQLLALAFDLTPQHLRQAVADHLACLVEQRGDKPATGFVGTALLLPVLTRYGHHELAYRVVNTRQFPSLGYMIDQGATTVWERWNTDKEGPAMNSRNHFCLGAMAQWFYEDLVGVRLSHDEPGFRKLLLDPRPVADLTFAQLTYQSPQGLIELRWEIYEGQLHYTADLPPNVHAEMWGQTPESPAITLGPGRHRLVMPLHGIEQGQVISNTT